MNVELWKLIASISVALVGVVTAPIIWAVKAEAGKLKAEIKLDIAELKLEMGKLEKRLSERIDTRLTHR